MAIAAALSPWVSNGQRLRAHELSSCARQDFRQTASVTAPKLRNGFGQLASVTT